MTDADIPVDNIASIIFHPKRDRLGHYLIKRCMTGERYRALEIGEYGEDGLACLRLTPYGVRGVFVFAEADPGHFYAVDCDADEEDGVRDVVKQFMAEGRR